jgi:hypothetical protein
MVPIDHQITKKRKKPTIGSIIGFFNTRMPYQKTNPTQEQFFEDLVFYIAKGYCPLSSTENVWLKRLVHH